MAHLLNRQMTLPDKIIIQLVTEDGQPFKQEDILIGIQTLAERKNDINLSPFLSDNNGKIEITNSQLRETADDFISYGIMDHLTIESAKDNIEIYLLGEKEIKDNLDYWSAMDKGDIESEIRNNPVYQMSSQKKEQLIKELKEVRIKESQRFDKFRKAYNNKLTTKFTTKLTDKWDGRQKEYHYSMTVKLR